MPENLIDSARSDSFATRLAGLLVQKQQLLLVASLVVMVLLSAGLLRLGFDTSFGALLTQSDPYLNEYERFETSFPSQIELSYAFEAQPGASVFDRHVLQAIAELEARYREIPQADRFSGLLDYFSPLSQERLFPRPLASYAQSELDTIADAALRDPLLTTNLLAPDLRLARAIVTISAPGIGDEERLAIAQAAVELRDELRINHPEVNVYLNSELLLERTTRQAMIDDLTTLLPIVIFVCVLSICYCFRSALLGLCILGQVVVTVICTVGVLGLLRFSFSSISVMAPLIVVIISVANSVHIVSLFRQALVQGSAASEAMRASLAANLRPVFLASLTTAIGFTSLNLCSAPAIQDFGRIVGIGIAFAFVLTFTLLPNLLLHAHASLKSAHEKTDGLIGSGLQTITALVERRDRSLFVGFSLLAGVSILLLPLNETDFNRLDFIPAGSDIDSYYDAVANHMERGAMLVYGIETGRVDGAIEPEFLRTLQGFTEALTQRATVESVASLDDVVMTIGRAANENSPEYFRIPDDIETVAYYLNSYEVVQSDDFPLSGFINDEFSMISLVVNARALSNQGLIDLDAQIGEVFTEYFDSAELVHGSGLLLFARMDELVTVELLQGYAVSLVLITLTLIVGLGSVYYGLLSILPNLLPAVIVFGFWGLFVGQVDPFVMMLFSISIGMVVDDTVHLLNHYLDGRREGLESEAAMSRSIKTAGPALTITTLVLALGTTIMIWANTLYFQQSAQLLVPIVVLALILDLLYLPTLLKRCDRKSVLTQ